MLGTEVGDRRMGVPMGEVLGEDLVGLLGWEESDAMVNGEVEGWGASMKTSQTRS